MTKDNLVYYLKNRQKQYANSMGAKYNNCVWIVFGINPQGLIRPWSPNNSAPKIWTGKWISVNNTEKELETIAEEILIDLKS